ncbi:MAG: hypothetical protein AB1631_17115 [Acidobacteriota bacterium]
MPQSLKKRAAELELRVKERAELVKKALKEYREIMRAASRVKEGRQNARLNKKRLHVERANAEYIQLQKELEQLRMRLQARK